MQDERVIGRFKGYKNGPLLIVIGAMHGNEPAGVRAIEFMVKMLEVEPITNPKFTYSGSFLGIRGNIKASTENKRFIKQDLNRLWTEENVTRILKSDKLGPEEEELLDIYRTIAKEVYHRQPTSVVVMDLHTTTAKGGIFSIPTDDPESERIASELHAPVIKGFLKGIKGTLLHYYSKNRFDVPCTAVCFESGQHEEDLSVNRAIAAITNCLRSLGSVSADDVENRHDHLLITYSDGLPKRAALKDVHGIKPGDEFRMKPGYKNFQPIKKGEVLAEDKHGEILASTDGLILMPLYQPQGDDGFFIIEATEK